MSALSNIKILDLSRVVAGPWCSQILGDLGAEVIKIERPNIGDDTRQFGPPWMLNDNGEDSTEASYFQSTNRNKLSVAVDIASEEGQELIRALAQDSDVFIENYKVGSLKKYGLDYETLHKINPNLVYCSITGFGQTGPRSDEPGYDFIIQGMGGLMSVTGEKDSLPGGGPQKVGVAVVDMFTGLYATISIIAALFNREVQDGKGQHIDISLLDSQIAMIASQGMNYLTTKKIPKRYGNAHANVVPYQVYKAQDQDFIIACGNDTQFKDLSEAIGLPELAQDKRFAKNANRIQYRGDLNKILSQHFLSKPAKQWIDSIQAKKVPVGSINNIAQAFEEPQVLEREMLISVKHPLKDKLQLIGSPIKMSETPVKYIKAPPLLGEHTDEVLREIISEEKLVELKQKGIIQQYKLS